MPPDEIVSAVRGLEESVMLFDSATTPDAMVALVETKSAGRSVVAEIHLDRMIGSADSIKSPAYTEKIAGDPHRMDEREASAILQQEKGRCPGTVQRALLAQGWDAQTSA